MKMAAAAVVATKRAKDELPLESGSPKVYSSLDEVAHTKTLNLEN